jgi:restriction endonuclease fold toxin 3 of polymorphic toxin system
VRIDRSDPADGPGDVHTARGVLSATDDLDATGKDNGTAVDGDGPPDSSRASPDSTLRTERTMAYRAVVDAAYRQYAIDRSDAQADTFERETGSPALSRTGVEDPERCLVGLADRLKGKGQLAEAERKSPPATDDTNAVTRDGAAYAFDHQPATAPGGDGSIGNGGGAQPPAGDTPPDPEGDDPEGVNGGLGELVNVNAKDRAADLLAERIGGEASVRFANGPSNEFDALSTEYVAQAKPANFTLNQAFRNQAKATFEVALQSGRTPYFQFDGQPGPGVLHTLSRYADRYGIEPVIDLTPLGEANA